MTVTAISENQLQQSVLDLAGYAGWHLRYHTLNSKGSAAGFPDLVLVRPPELLVAELKSERGKLTGPQRAWLQALDVCGIEVHVWRPADWHEIERRLTRPRSGRVHWSGTRLGAEAA